MQRNNSVKAVCEFIWDMEEELKLLSWKTNDIFIWQIIRMKVYYALMMQSGIFQNPHPGISSHRRGFEKFKRSFKKRYTKVLRNPLSSFKKYDNIVFPHSRKVNGVDIYTEQITQELGKEAMVIDCLESSSWSQYCMPPIKASYSAELSMKDLRLLEDITRQINAFMQIDIDLRELVVQGIENFKTQYDAYYALFQRHRPKRIVTTVAYFHPYIVAAAKALGVQVLECQHGTITKYHLGYSYPQHVELEYAPEILLTFGKYWTDTMELPVNTKTIVIGAPYIDAIKKGNRVAKIPQSITFCSQGVIGEQLFDFAVEVARRLPKHTISFKLHPSELLPEYEDRLSTRPTIPKNFNLIFKSPGIFELLAASEYQAGVFSTTLFEGIPLDTKVVLIDMVGSEYMAPLRKRHGVPLVSTPEEFVEKFHKANLISDPEYYYAPAAESILQLLDS